MGQYFTTGAICAAVLGLAVSCPIVFTSPAQADWRDPRDYRQPREYRRDWSFCANEGDFCQAWGGAVVRYGRDGYFVQRRAGRDGIPCTNRAFGVDPLPGVNKRCYVAR